MTRSIFLLTVAATHHSLNFNVNWHGCKRFSARRLCERSKKRTETPEGYYSLEKVLRDLIDDSAKVAACGTCLNARAIQKEDLVEGVEIGTMLGLQAG